MEEIGHGVYEHAPGSTPAEWLRHFLGNETKVKTLFVGMAFHSAEPLRKRLGIAVLAAGTDLGATPNGIPGRVCPLD